jgi:hypothetical protein
MILRAERSKTNGGAAWLATAVALAVCLSVPGRANAQHLLDQYLSQDVPGTLIEPGVTVASRLRPDYDPIDFRIGEITIRPELLNSLGFDDNVFGQKSHRASALIETNAQIQANYDHSDTKGFSTLTVDNYRYPEQNQQSYTNWTASLGGSHQFGRDNLSVAYDHLNLNQTARDLDTPQLTNPLPYNVDVFRLDYKAMLSRLFIEPALGLSNYNFTNGSINNTPYIQTNRDRVVVEPALTFGYELAPQRDVVLVVRDAVAFYRNEIAGQSSRNFDDVSALAGLDFEEGIFRYRLLVGYESRSFTSVAYKTIAAPIAEASVIWNPTGLTTLTGQASRRIQDSADETTIAFTETAVGMRVDHEYQRNVILSAGTSYLRDDYSQKQGEQELITFSTSATWLLNRNLRLVGSYEFNRRNSTLSGDLGPINGQPFGQSYSDDRFLITFHFTL